jgi:hypothetical protein
MKHANRLATLALAALLATGCKENEIPVYDAPGYLQFTLSHADSLETFVQFSKVGGTEYRLPLELIISSLPPADDVPYEIEVQKERSTAFEGIDFTFSEKIFRAGRFTDTLWVTIKKTDALQTKTKRLLLRLKAQPPFLDGVWLNRNILVRFHDMLSKPAWWGFEVEQAILGSYSNVKYTLFLEHGGITGELPEEPSSSWLRARALLFKYWLEEENATHPDAPLRDENNRVITVPVIG